MTATATLGDWRERARCHGHTAGWVDADVPTLTSHAVTLCAACEVQPQCHAWLMSHDVDPCPAHVVAGLTVAQRRLIPGRVVPEIGTWAASHA